jgi:hypothetical protein
MSRRSDARAVVVRIVCVVALGAVLAACDRCGDFVPPIKLKMQACQDDAQHPQ